VLSAPELKASLSPRRAADRRLTILPTPEVDLKRGATSIDLRLGRWFRSFKQTHDSFASLVKDSGRIETLKSRQHWVPFGEAFMLHPGRFVLAATLEWLQLPRGLSGYITGKSSLGRHGLIIETASGIHPCFSGCLTLELANVGEIPLKIFPGMPVCQVFFHRVKPSPLSHMGRMSGRRKPSIIPLGDDDIFDALRFEPEHNRPLALTDVADEQ
jgi:dCTP deaminase